MKISVLEFTEGASQAEGVTVIIDVFRAFSVACYAFYSGAVSVIATSGPNEAFRLKAKYIKPVLVGERNERKIEGFDFGNSPTEILTADLSGKTVILTTTAGTRGLLNAVKAPVLLAAGLVNAGAVARYIGNLNPETVSLVAMGYKGETRAEEDIICARIIADRLAGREKDYTSQIALLKETSGKRFFIPENRMFSPPSDFFLCTMTDRFDFALKAERRHDGNIELIKTDI